MKKLLALLFVFVLLLGAAFAQTVPQEEILVFAPEEVLVDLEEGVALAGEDLLIEYGYDYYYTEEVALYLYAFGELPPNFITKQEARDLGWVSSKGNLWEVAYGLAIGGDEFGNREGILPKEKGRQYYECDVNYQGGFREAERIVFANDGGIYYTGDHYESFLLLYEDWYIEDYLYDPEYLWQDAA